MTQTVAHDGTPLATVRRIELTVVDVAGLSGTSLMVGSPGVRWLPESVVERFGPST